MPTRQNQRPTLRHLKVKAENRAPCRGGGGVKPRRVDHGVPAPPTGRLAPMMSRTNSLNPQIGTQRQDACWASAP